jgi:hypothetical protein
MLYMNPFIGKRASLLFEKEGLEGVRKILLSPHYYGYEAVRTAEELLQQTITENVKRITVADVRRELSRAMMNNKASIIWLKSNNEHIMAHFTELSSTEEQTLLEILGSFE